MELRHVDPAGLDLSLARLRQLPEAAVKAKEASFRSKGQLSPLVAASDEDGRLVLVDGFVRQLAAVRLGLESVLVEVVQLSPSQRKAQVYLRNRERGLQLIELVARAGPQERTALHRVGLELHGQAGVPVLPLADGVVHCIPVLEVGIDLGGGVRSGVEARLHLEEVAPGVLPLGRAGPTEVRRCAGEVRPVVVDRLDLQTSVEAIDPLRVGVPHGEGQQPDLGHLEDEGDQVLLQPSATGLLVSGIAHRKELKRELVELRVLDAVRQGGGGACKRAGP